MPKNIPCFFRSEPPDIFLSREEHERVCNKLDEMLGAICDSAHERCAQLLCAQPSSTQTVTRLFPFSSYFLFCILF